MKNKKKRPSQIAWLKLYYDERFQKNLDKALFEAFGQDELVDNAKTEILKTVFGEHSYLLNWDGNRHPVDHLQRCVRSALRPIIWSKSGRKKFPNGVKPSCFEWINQSKEAFMASQIDYAERFNIDQVSNYLDRLHILDDIDTWSQTRLSE